MCHSHAFPCENKLKSVVQAVPELLQVLRKAAPKPEAGPSAVSSQSSKALSGGGRNRLT